MREVQKELRTANKDLKAASKDVHDAKRREEEAAARVQRLKDAESALSGATERRKYVRRVTRADVRKDLLEHPNSYSSDVARRLEIPVTNAGSHLSNGKKDNEFQEHRGQWSVIE